MPNFCQSCGKELSPGAAFCENCGAPASAQPAYQQPAQQPVYQQPPVGQPYVQPTYAQPYGYAAGPVVYKPSVPGRGFGIASLVLGIIGTIYAFFYLCAAILLAVLLGTGNRLYGEAAAFAFVPASFYIGFVLILSVLALAFSIVALVNGYKNGKSIAGLILAGISFLFLIIGFVLIFSI